MTEETSNNELILAHNFVPKHELLSEEETSKVLEKYGIKKSQLPKILKTDPAILHLKTKRGDVIKITRESRTAEKSLYYRVVI